MAKIGRNEPCPCGSGRKAKRCSRVPRGPAEGELARAFVAGEALVASTWLAGCEDVEFESLWDELFELPARHLSLHLPLPRLVTPELEPLIEALRDDAAGEDDEALDDALARLDTPAARAILARAVIDLRVRASASQWRGDCGRGRYAVAAPATATEAKAVGGSIVSSQPSFSCR